MLSAIGLDAGYGDGQVLHGVDLAIPAGKTVALLGRNGMGKTTLIRTLMGYVPARAGIVRWQGRDVTHSPPERMARLGIGYVPEGRGIFPTLSVREHLLVAARAGTDGCTAWTLDRVLALFPRLAERLRHSGQHLSGGEQQMLSIGRALMTNPALLILDEATEGLAPRIVEEIWRVLDTVRHSGMSTLIVDRHASLLLARSDLAVVLEKGRVVLQGESAHLAAMPEALGRHLGV